MSQIVLDGSEKRPLPPNELAVMALNEVAAAHGIEFLYHMPNRDSWRHESVKPEYEYCAICVCHYFADYSSGTSIPTLFYTRFIWRDEDRQRFLAQPHRARYPLSSGLLHPLSPSTPIFCF
ncbi:hypothetical protein P154DRAFT_624999 [Amniculicola lignicola CBS 123094]|uniref:Uncharacterized protein n=1 Tax=Amniculicola lignicola CBS 123094 TaxID=1392246 RepID=A0A6A5VZD9_9PLEO|nr:hypothetical protein P154DRAFT_624999 [Amniculicola lignicola CBS 123094]